MRLFAFFVFALALVCGPVSVGSAAAATLDQPRVNEGPTPNSEEVITAAQRIKAALVRLQPCPSVEVARYAIGLASEGVKLEVLLLALQLQRHDDDLCRGAKRGVSQALEDARLALASMGATGATSAAGRPGSSGPNVRTTTFSSIASLGGLPGGAGGSGYRH